MRLFIIMGLGLTLTVTSACQGDGKRRASFKKEAADQKATSPRAKAISALVGDSKCLRIDKLVSALMQAPGETMIEYTSDTNFIEQGSNLSLDRITAGQLLKEGSMSSFLNINYDEKCTSVSFHLPEMAASQGTTFAVDQAKSNKNQLVVTNKATMETLIFEFNRNDSLKLTHEAPGGLSCKKGGTYKVKNVLVLAYGEALNELKVSRQLIAILDRAGVATPTEITRKLYEDNLRTRTIVPMVYPTYMSLVQTAATVTATKPICP